MNYGLYLSASGVLTNMYRQDVFANNLANSETVGYKPDRATISQRPPESIEDGFRPEYSQKLLDRLGGGVLAGPQHISFQPGTLQETSGPLDLALTQDKAFFAVADTDPSSGAMSIRLTRDGRMGRDDQGYLIQMASGKRVLDTDDAPIRVNAGATVTINSDGQVIQQGEVVGQIQVSGVADTRVLTKQGQSLFAWHGNDPRTAVESPGIKQGYVERSAVDPIRALMELTGTMRAVNFSAQMISMHNRLMGQAVNTLGRIA